MLSVWCGLLRSMDFFFHRSYFINRFKIYYVFSKCISLMDKIKFNMSNHAKMKVFHIKFECLLEVFSS